MPLLVVNSDPERLWGSSYKTLPDYLCFEFYDYDYTSDHKLVFSVGSGVPSFNNITSISYSVNEGDTWVTTEISQKIDIEIPIISGLKILWKGSASTLKGCSFKTTNLTSYGNYPLVCNVSGNVMSLLYDDEFEDKIMFPAGSSQNFSGLFSEFDAGSFDGIKLPATILTPQCYGGMFYVCHNLVKTPELPAPVLEDYCYYQIFAGCPNINYIKMLGTSIADGATAYRALRDWVSYAGNGEGTFIQSKDIEFELPYGNNGIPYGWTVEEV